MDITPNETLCNCIAKATLPKVDGVDDMTEESLLTNSKFFEKVAKKTKTEELHYLGQMLTATTGKDTERIAAIIEQLQKLCATNTE